MKKFFITLGVFIFLLFAYSNRIFAQTYGSNNTPNAVVKNLEQIHVVEEGQHLAMISKKYGVKIQEIRTWNNLTSDKLHLGQQLTLFVKHVEEIHKVTANENLQEIANTYGVAPNKILEWNKLQRASEINEGMNLKIYIMKKNIDK